MYLYGPNVQKKDVDACDMHKVMSGVLVFGRFLKKGGGAAVCLSPNVHFFI